MHHALLISEVLGCIVDFLAEDTVRHPKSFHARDTRRAGRQALAVLARTCRVFSDPALDALWRRLHSLEPFLLHLPVEADGSDDGGPFNSFGEEKWDIQLHYAPRVQELTLENEVLSMKMLQSLCSRTALGVLLPNLRKLQWVHNDLAAIGSIRLLLSSSLVHLHVWLDRGDHSSALEFLECYHTLCPNLKSLYLGHSSVLPHVTTAVSHAITRSPNLEILSCETVDEDAMAHIAKSRRLKKLSVRLLDYLPSSLKKLARYGTPDHPLFENLRVLELRVEDLSSIIPYLRSHHQPFEDVSIDFRMHHVPEVFHQFFSALSSAPRQQTLRRIRLYSLSSDEPYMSLQPVDFGILSPLSTFRLHTFDVNINNPVSLRDDELSLMVRGWPELETFHLNQHKVWACVPSLKGLLHLISNCPKLRHLGMCVDARNVPPSSKGSNLIRNEAITVLWLANSPVQEPFAKVARFLLKHFPSLIIVRPLNSREYGSMWKEVNNHLNLISKKSLS